MGWITHETPMRFVYVDYMIEKYGRAAPILMDRST
jgi:hypothetical protein